MNVKEEIQRAIKHGIFLGDMELEEEKDFLKQLLMFLINKKNFATISRDGRTISVSSDVEELAQIYVHTGTLKIAPLASEGYFSIFMDVLEFIAKKHKEEMEALNPTPEIEEITEEDESTEDDGEWWL